MRRKGKVAEGVPKQPNDVTPSPPRHPWPLMLLMLTSMLIIGFLLIAPNRARGNVVVVDEPVAHRRWMQPVVVVEPVRGDQQEQGNGDDQEESVIDQLATRTRTQCMLALDKDLYRSGEDLFMALHVVDAFTHKPTKLDAQANSYKVEVLSGLGAVVHTSNAWLPYGRDTSKEQDGAHGVLAGKLSLRDAWAAKGGRYTLRVSVPGQCAPSERAFQLRSFRSPRLKLVLTFLRRGYSAGDRVEAIVSARRAEGGAVPAGTRVRVSVSPAPVDFGDVGRETDMDDSGEAVVAVTLPAQEALAHGASMTVTVLDGGVVESTSKPIPVILPQSASIRVTPESTGNILVPHVLNRLYVEARTASDNVLDAELELVTSDGEAILTIETGHEGRARFEFEPKAGVAYALRIVRPSGLEAEWTALPPVSATVEGLEVSAAVLRASDDVFRANDPVRIEVATCGASTVVLKLSMLERELASHMWTNTATGCSTETVIFDQLPDTVAGVLRVTAVDEESGLPIAERLIFRKPSRALQVKISLANSEGGEQASTTMTPNAPVSVLVEVLDAGTSEPVPHALVSAIVTDSAVTSLVEQRRRAPRLPAMVFLEKEVEELRDADVYLGGEPLLVDLLLGTQGWRRFAYAKLDDFVKEFGDAARRMVVLPDERQVFVAQPAFAFAGMANERAGGMIQKMAMRAPVADMEMLAAAPVPVEDAGDDAPNMDAAEPDDAMPKRPHVRVAVDPGYVAIRVYAHKQRTGEDAAIRRDFTDTLYFAAALETDATGRVVFSFAVSDAITQFDVMVDAFTPTSASVAAFGSEHTPFRFTSVRPFFIEPVVPQHVTRGDRVVVPIGVVNNGQDVTLRVSSQVNVSVPLRAGDDPMALTLAPGERSRQLVTMEVVNDGDAGVSTIRVDSTATGSIVDGLASVQHDDSVERAIAVFEKGFPITVKEGLAGEAGESVPTTVTPGGLLDPDSSVAFHFDLPESLVPGSLSLHARSYPTPAASLMAALEALLQEPHGCFEQTSSTTYPIVMALQYFQSHRGVDGSVVRRATQLLDKGYDKLMGFEVDGGGFEWFGSEPAHEALTAYGLLQFTDMSAVREVDASMLSRTQEWLLSRLADDKRGFMRSDQALDSFGRASPLVTDAFIVWSLMEAGIGLERVRPAIEALVTRADETQEDGYVVGLTAAILFAAAQGKGETAAHDLQRAMAMCHVLLRLQEADSGGLYRAEHSITMSRGESLHVETTSIAVLAWLSAEQQTSGTTFTPAIEHAIRWLAERCKGGAFGSTQGTVLALKAIIGYDAKRSATKAAGQLRLTVDGRHAGEPLDFDAGVEKVLDLSGGSLHPGRHSAVLSMVGGSRMPFSFDVQYMAVEPASGDAPVALQVRLQDELLQEGDGTRLAVSVTNVARDENGDAASLGMVVAIAGIPAGLVVSHDQLRGLIDEGKIASYELLGGGRELVLYWRAMAASAVHDVHVDVVGSIPGVYEGAASRAYAYYQAEDKVWASGVRVEVSPLS